MSSVDAESIFNMLTSVLQQLSKDWSTVLAVCFDGAMFGSISRVRAKCKQKILIYFIFTAMLIAFSTN